MFYENKRNARESIVVDYCDNLGQRFVAQSVSMDYVGPFTFQAVRNLLGALALLPVILLSDRKKKKEGKMPMSRAEKKQLWIGGLVCGAVLGLAGCLQQIGVQHTTVGKAGFITALYILIVPVLGLLFHKKVPLKIWGCIAIAVVGLYLLCMQDSFSLSKGDTFVALCALGFSVHIMVVDYYAARVDGLKLSCLQFFVAGLFSIIPMLLTEKPDMQGIFNAWLPILYGGVFSSGIGYTLQVLGAKIYEANGCFSADEPGIGICSISRYYIFGADTYVERGDWLPVDVCSNYFGAASRAEKEVGSVIRKIKTF